MTTQSKSIRRFVRGWAAAVGCAAAMTGAHLHAAAAGPLVMKIGTATLNDSTHEWIKLFKADVEKDSGGRITVQIYPASQLGNSERMTEQTQLGTIQGVVEAPELIVGVDPRYQALASPGLFNDLAHAQRVLQDPTFNKAFLDLGADKGLKGVGLLIGGPSVFVTREPVRKLADFSGLKIRVLASRLQSAQIRALHATPVPMSLGEVLPALQQGAIDGVMGGIPVLTALHFYDAAKYLLETDHALIAAVAVFSKSWFDQLPPDLQKIVVEDGQKASEQVYAFAVHDIDRARNAWIKNGGVVNKLSPEEQAKMMQELEKVGEQINSNSPREKAMFEILHAAVERTAKQ
jgi:TRAP-type C4-dicarboxylate transport system substrate-binding protein